ncbi:MAG: single-stranded DNA-binding protein [Bacteroidales bacterium]|jgi:single-strand DNA-binding protein|nr:single-stranded DNA-binding protein [Bacteroidales bacterium]NLM92496.1 single-stranded DNA-binding protein [Bacteroidales bacterium]
MAGVNKVILLGNLGKDPVVRTIESGNKVANFSLATNRIFKGQDGNPVEETEWHNIVLWGRLAEIAEKYLNKGSKVYIEGRIRSRQYDDKEGIKRYITEIVGETMNMLGSRTDTNEHGQKSEPESTSMGETPIVEDDLPF